LAQKPETRFVAKIKPLLNNINDAVWFNIQQLSLKGTPDILGCVNGTFVALEVKRDAKEIAKRDNRTRLQEHNLRRIRYAGGYASFLHPDNWDDVYRDLLRLSMDTFNLEEYQLQGRGTGE
jgi:hypothetical protein